MKKSYRIMAVLIATVLCVFFAGVLVGARAEDVLCYTDACLYWQYRALTAESFMAG